MASKVISEGTISQVVKTTLTDGSEVYDVVLKPKRIICETSHQASLIFYGLEGVLGEHKPVDVEEI